MLCQVAHNTLIGSHHGDLGPGSDECTYIPASPVEFLQFCPSTRDFTRTSKSLARSTSSWMQMDNFCAKFNQLCGLAATCWLQSPILQKLQDVKGLSAYSALSSCVFNEVQIEVSSKENLWATELSPTAFITTLHVLHVISPIFLFHMSTIWISSTVHPSFALGNCQFPSCLRLGTNPADLPLAGQKMRWALADLAMALRRIDASFWILPLFKEKFWKSPKVPKQSDKAGYFAISCILYDTLYLTRLVS